MNLQTLGALKVRVANPTDYPDLARIYASTIFAGFPAHQVAALITPRHVAIAAENTVLLVAEAFGLVVGGIGISGHKNHLTPRVEAGELQVFWCGVEPQWQGKGIGRLLISAVITSLRNSALDCTRLVIQILEARHTALGLAASIGATRRPDRDGVNEDGDPYRTFEIDLTNKA
ncbi:GNAT family N-acetyltransferase [Paenarthrobacter nicotinovorans]|uniref:GNAT family N-acetyltransferase n=1 Tax=Paenarthrobacter nicotinovorans TaxID=29320 RepID=UPI003A803B66